MYFWGLYIDTVTSVMLILAIGLCVDYAAHIGHAFMTANQQTKDGKLNFLFVCYGLSFSVNFQCSFYVRCKMSFVIFKCNANSEPLG